MFREQPYTAFANVIENAEQEMMRPSMRTPDNPARLAWREWARKLDSGTTKVQDKDFARLLQQ